MDINKSIRSAIEHSESGNLEQAESICREILNIQPDNSEALHLLGLISYKRSDLDPALKLIRKAIKHDPNSADAYYDLGNILQEKGQISKAITQYRKAIKIYPDYFEAYNNMGIALQDNMQLDKAIKSYKEAILINPAYAEAHNNIGVAFQEKKQPGEAITHFQKALLLKSDYANAYHNLVDAVQGKGYEDKDKDKDKDKTRKKVVYAVYRCFAGEDFIQESIQSINDHVDQIFVFWNKALPENVTECVYKGETIQFPDKIDGVVEKVRALNNPKVELIQDYHDVGENQLTHLVNDVILPANEKPSILFTLEADDVFRSDQIGKAIDEFIEMDYVFATTDQVEIWKGLRHRLPERPDKVGAVFCSLRQLDKMPFTLKHGGILVMPKLSSYAHNFSFGVSEKAMYWKHLISLAVSRKQGDSVPSEDWYEEKWAAWDDASNNENLEISEHYRNARATPYDVNELPELIKKKLQ